jgi:hypothetical protein
MTSWPITEELRAWWQRWGLSIESLDRSSHHPWWNRPSAEQVQEIARRHTLVTSYLERHPDVAARYQPDQRGELRYPDIVALAEAEDCP